MNFAACLVTAATVVVSISAAAQELRQITEKLEYGRETQANTDAADRLFEALQDAAAAGAPVKLSLSLIPDPKAGDDLTQFGYTMLPLASSDESGMVACGQDLSGVVDTYRTDYQLSLNHPDNYHHPTTIQVGERHDFPLNALSCSLSRGSEQPAALLLQGTFTATAADISTATSLHLFPYNP